MKKKNFVSMIMSTIGGILFAIGMCMCLLPQWNAFTQGVVIGIVGAVVLLAMLIVRRRHVHGYGLGDANPGHFGGRCRHRSAALFNPVDKRFEVRRHLL